MTRKRALFLLAPLLGALSACKAGPDYMRPSLDFPMEFKEDKGWMPASPQQAAGWTAWWGVYNDPALDALEQQVDISNQNLKAAEAAYRASRAEVGVQRGALFPAVTANASFRESGGGGRGGVANANNGTAGSRGSGSSSTGLYQATLAATWDIDVWGRIRRTIEASVATAQASDADIAAARLSAQSQLAIEYFQLRAADAQAEILMATVEDFRMALNIAQNRYNAGIATLADVYAAQTQIDNAESQLVNIRLTRTLQEHAIATLTGKPASEMGIEVAPIPTVVPVVPVGIPSALVERRPDVAAAEYTVTAANAQIGVATSAWFPNLTLAGSYGVAGSSLGSLFNASNALWSVGPSLAEVVFNGGTRASQIEETRAHYDQTVATYRQTVLTALQQVEDELAALRILEEQAAVQERTVNDARQQEELTLNQYRAGTADFTAVIVAQTQRFNAETAALAVLNQRLAASVNLIVALGGGWDTSLTPQPSRFYNLPVTAEK